MEGNTHTRFEKLRLTSIVDRLPLAIEVIEPIGPIYGVIQISHGMAEHKERYRDFMQFLSAHGYVVAIHDHIKRHSAGRRRSSSPARIGSPSRTGHTSSASRPWTATSRRA